MAAAYIVTHVRCYMSLRSACCTAVLFLVHAYATLAQRVPPFYSNHTFYKMMEYKKVVESSVVAFPGPVFSDGSPRPPYNC